MGICYIAQHFDNPVFPLSKEYLMYLMLNLYVKWVINKKVLISWRISGVGQFYRFMGQKA